MARERVSARRIRGISPRRSGNRSSRQRERHVGITECAACRFHGRRESSRRRRPDGRTARRAPSIVHLDAAPVTAWDQVAVPRAGGVTEVGSGDGWTVLALRRGADRGLGVLWGVRSGRPPRPATARRRRGSGAGARGRRHARRYRRHEPGEPRGPAAPTGPPTGPTDPDARPRRAPPDPQLTPDAAARARPAARRGPPHTRRRGPGARGAVTDRHAPRLARRPRRRGRDPRRAGRPGRAARRGGGHRVADRHRRVPAGTRARVGRARRRRNPSRCSSTSACWAA